MSDDGRPRRGTFLLNRFVLVPAAIAVAIAAWNVWVATHDSGLVRGVVVGPDGSPVADATVSLWAVEFTTFQERARAQTDQSGGFVFSGNQSHHIQLTAEKNGVGRSPRVEIRLYFRAQEVELARPLRIEPGAS
jgi:hypothetical protein